MLKSREIHRKIRNIILQLEKDDKHPCISITTIVKASKNDARTVRLHLELLEEDGWGKFCDKDKQTFTTKNV